MKPANKNNFDIKGFNNTKKEFGCDNLNRLFLKSFELYPDRPAVSDSERILTYRELDIFSDEIAVRLLEQGIEKQTSVGVYAEKKVETVANIVGILKAGDAYVPVNPELPEARQKYIMKNGGCKLLLFPEKLEASKCRRLQNKIEVQGRDTAYIIYTSGSTGFPKGVEIAHSAVTNTVLDVNERFNIDRNDVIIGLSSFSFDLSVYDIFGALSTGARLVLVNDQRDMKNVARLMEKEKITLWNTVPAFMEFLLSEEDYDFHASELRNIFLSGDWIPLNLIPKIKKNFPKAAITSLGGATEASIWSIFYTVESVDPGWKSIPYGYPLSNQQIYILDDNNNICRAGEKGQIYIGGKGVAKGYINDEEKTKNAFIHKKEFGYIYKTGDYGIFTEEGYVEFCGRIDSQVKVNGFRIELGEIENQTVCCSGVQGAKAVCMQAGGNSKILGLAYTTMLNSKVNSEEVRLYLKENLPYYSIPSIIGEIPKIPVTINGKIDTKAIGEFLLKPQTTGMDEREDTELEKQLIEIWRSVLEDGEINRTSDFFIHGGNSLKAMRIMEKITNNEITSGKPPLNTIFFSSTVSELAYAIETFNKGSSNMENRYDCFEEGEI